MGLRINTNVAGLRTTRILRGTTLDLNKSLERLSSGLRINRAADDAAGIAIAEGFRSVSKAAVVSQRNAQDGISLVQTAEGALSTVINILQRIRELAVQSANGTNSAQNRADLQLEVTELVAQIDDIATNTEFNGVTMLDGTLPAISLQVGARATSVLTIAISADINPVDLFPAPPSAVAGVVDIDDQVNARASLAIIDTALSEVNTQRSAFGAAQNRLEFTITSLQVQEENSVAAESAIRDADIARETIAFTRAQILVSAGTSILAQANVIPQTALQLLGG